MEVANITVKKCVERGRRHVNALRAAGEIPAVIYGKGKDNVHLAVNGHELTQLVMTHHKLFELHFDDGSMDEAFLQEEYGE